MTKEDGAARPIRKKQRRKPVEGEVTRKMINKGEAFPVYDTPPPEKVRHSGLRRNLATEQMLRDMIEKFHNDIKLSDKELRFLIQYYGIMIRMCEIEGDLYYLAHRDATLNYERLLEMAKERDWTQAIINMYGVLIESVFERIL